MPSLPNMIKNVFKLSNKGLYVPDNVHSFAVNGSVVEVDTTSATDPTITGTRNLRACGYASLSAGGAVTFLTANPLTDRPRTVDLNTGSSSGTVIALFGATPLGATSAIRRYNIPTSNFDPIGNTKLVLETYFVASTLTSTVMFAGWVDDHTANASGSARKAIGALFESAADATNWLAYTNNGTTSTKTSSGVAASTSAVTRIKVEWSSATMTVFVNGTATTVTATFPTGTDLRPCVQIVNGAATAQHIYLERLYDRYE